MAVGDSEALATVRKAERLFHEACAQGVPAFTVKLDYSIERMERFVLAAEQIVLIRCAVGG